MSDLQETPATPPEELGGDERAGFLGTGVLLTVLGWGVGVVLNAVVHLRASAGGTAFGPWVIFPHLGVFAWGAALIGAFGGALGASMVALGRGMPKGRIVLPGFSYP